MDKLNFFPNNLEIQNQKIILRLDLNVPIKDKIIFKKPSKFSKPLATVKRGRVLIVQKCCLFDKNKYFH